MSTTSRSRSFLISAVVEVDPADWVNQHGAPLDEEQLRFWLAYYVPHPIRVLLSMELTREEEAA